jgi:RNA polymerase sigma-54 factor
MAVSQKLELRQRLAPVITPQLRQAIKLLQLTNQELSAHVEQELDRNPLLEWAAPETETPGETPGETEELADWGTPAASDGSHGDSWMERQAERPADLSSHLLHQIGLTLTDAGERRIGRHLVEALDERGYLTIGVEDVAGELGCPPEEVAEVLRRLQACEPAGVFARSLAECLALQLADMGRLDAPMRCLLENLELVADGDLVGLRRICEVDGDRLAEMLAVLRGLDPKPGLTFTLSAEPVDATVPDLILKGGPAGKWRVEMNLRTLPRVMVNRGYYEELQAMIRQKKDREYLSERLQEAGWLVRAIAQRTATMLKVAEAIVEHQQAFFRHGAAALKPLTLREVAEAVEMHESTISRVTSNKYIATPAGLFPLRYFFTAALAGTDGEVHAAEAVRHRIREIVGAESGDKPFSDEAIARRLRSEGVDIARRTVAKYRETLRIPSSSQRRRQRNAGI